MTANYTFVQYMLTSLTATDVLAIDCQTTGASPQRGHLLEVGWARARASSQRPAQVVSHLVALPPGEGVPAAVTRVTGIDDEALAGAIAPEQVWRRLAAAARPVAFAVIHYARFELAFLHDLHAACAPQQAFGIDVVCSHQVATRLLPHLPRRGLRAVAGYFGLGLGTCRRADGHARATVFVWHHLVAELARQGITQLAELRAWLDATPTRGRGRKVYPMPRSLRLDLPEQPGVYRMRRATGELLYVGKAMCLRQRVNSYFQKQSRVPERTLEMLSQARDVEVTVTATTVEAALLESDEIKRQTPPYNVALVDRPWQLAYCDGRFRIATGADARFGPLSRAAEVLVTGAIADVLAGRQPAAVLAELFAEREPQPAVEVVEAGVRVFWARWFGDVDVSTPELAAAQLRTLAAQLWAERLQQPAVPAQAAGGLGRGAEDIEPEPAPEPEPEREWDGERVAKALTGIVVRAGRALRRGRWFADLSEASVAWAESGQCRVLQISEADIAAREWRMGAVVAPLPLEFERPAAERFGSFTSMSYDRLRVLTTELRRLVVAGEVEVCFGPGRRLRGARLARALRWV